MGRLYLLRHAKAGWAAPGMCDFDRPLDDAGTADAIGAGVMMLARGYLPELVLCSSARRARETLDGVARNVDIGRTLFSDGLYSTDAAGYVEAVSGAPPADSMLVIGHNPMMEDVAMALAGDGDKTANGAIQAGFPTSGLAVLRFERPLADIAPGKGYLEAFLTPSDF